MATFVSFARRNPITTLAGTAGSLAIAYQSRATYLQASESRSTLRGSAKNFPIASASEASKGTFEKGGFQVITLEEAKVINHNVKMLRFKLPEGDDRSGLKPITSLLTQHTAQGAWIPTLRPYTPIDKDEPGHVTFLVKKYPNGKGSGHMHSMKPGDTIKARAIHEFDYKPNELSHLSILAGGAGITPFLQLIRSVTRDPNDKTTISLVYSNSTEEDVLLKSEFDQLAASKPDRFKINYVVTKPSSNSSGGHITKAIIEQSLPPKEAWDKAKVLVCGPPPMMETVAGAKGLGGFTQGSLSGLLKEIGLNSSQVQKF